MYLRKWKDWKYNEYIYIYGAGKIGKYVANEIRKMAYIHEKRGKKYVQEGVKEQIDILGFIDKSIEGNVIIENKSIPVCNIETFLGKIENVDAVFVAALDEINRQDMVLNLLHIGFKKIYVIPKYVYTAKLPIMEKGKLQPYIKEYTYNLPILPYIEFHVTDFCNLKCRRCGHCSNLFTEVTKPDFKMFCDSLSVLKKRFRNIKTFRLMGGEPLVNDELPQFIETVRQAFPKTNLCVVTNGLLISKIRGKIAESIRDNGVTLHISQYKPTRDNIEQIIDIIEKEGIDFEVGPPIEKFMARKLCKKEGSLDTYYSCINRNCRYLRDGVLYGCPAVWVEQYFKDYFESDIDLEEIKISTVDLINGEENGWNILEKFEFPFESCKRCAPKEEWYSWEVSDIDNISKDDWRVNL